MLLPTDLYPPLATYLDLVTLARLAHCSSSLRAVLRRQLVAADVLAHPHGEHFAPFLAEAARRQDRVRQRRSRPKEWEDAGLGVDDGSWKQEVEWTATDGDVGTKLKGDDVRSADLHELLRCQPLPVVVHACKIALSDEAHRVLERLVLPPKAWSAVDMSEQQHNGIEAATSQPPLSSDLVNLIADAVHGARWVASRAMARLHLQCQVPEEDLDFIAGRRAMLVLAPASTAISYGSGASANANSTSPNEAITIETFSNTRSTRHQPARSLPKTNAAQAAAPLHAGVLRLVSIARPTSHYGVTDEDLLLSLPRGELAFYASLIIGRFVADSSCCVVQFPKGLGREGRSVVRRCCSGNGLYYRDVLEDEVGGDEASEGDRDGEWEGVVEEEVPARTRRRGGRWKRLKAPVQARGVYVLYASKETSMKMESTPLLQGVPPSVTSPVSSLPPPAAVSGSSSSTAASGPVLASQTPLVYDINEDGHIILHTTDSVTMICPYEKIETVTYYENTPGTSAYLFSILFCTLGFPCCFFVPCCYDRCRNQVHRCSSCKRVLANVEM
ncbi:hypothetical protein HK101_006895 [Irineochytrium annulatum]|nr:hypothetical protein HK101_006895 [Irineochytrium annulatum]